MSYKTNILNCHTKLAVNSIMTGDSGDLAFIAKFNVKSICLR